MFVELHDCVGVLEEAEPRFDVRKAEYPATSRLMNPQSFTPNQFCGRSLTPANGTATDARWWLDCPENTDAGPPLPSPLTLMVESVAANKPYTRHTDFGAEEPSLAPHRLSAFVFCVTFAVAVVVAASVALCAEVVVSSGTPLIFESVARSRFAVSAACCATDGSDSVTAVEDDA